MAKKQKMTGFQGMMKRWIKPALKATTHIFTVGGVILAGTPLYPGLTAASKGQFTQAGADLKQFTVGNDPSVTASVKAFLVNVVLPVVGGTGLVIAGNQLRKRIGN